MRLGVLDVGSNTVHLLVVDAYPGARPLPAFSHKAEIRLADHLENGGRLSAKGEHRLREFVTDALRIAEDKGVEDFVGFATSAIRDAVNGEEVLAADHRADQGPHQRPGRGGRGPADVPGRPALVRLVVRPAAGPRHRRWLAGDRFRRG